MPRPDDRFNDAADDLYEGPSKTRLKKEAHELQALGASLLDLPDSQLVEVEMEGELRDALTELRRMRSHGARRRQLQLVGKLLRSADPEPLRRALEAWKLGLQLGAKPFVDAELWRTRLLSEDAALTEWIEQHPEDSVQELRQLIRNTRREEATAKKGEPVLNGDRPHGRYFRELFRHVRNVMQQAAVAGKR